MGVDHKLIKAGNGVDYPKNGDTVAIDYTGTLYDPNSTDEYKRGKQWVLSDLFPLIIVLMNLRFDTTTGRGVFETPIGVGRVIKGHTCPCRWRLYDGLG